MENGLAIFENEKFGQVRVVEKDGEPWFVAKDVCVCLDISNSRDALTTLDDDEKGVAIADTPGGPQEMQTVSESGFYTLVFKSRKPEAKAFRKWVTSEVIPAIRKTGKYELPINPNVEIPKNYESKLAAAKVVFESNEIVGNQLTLALDAIYRKDMGQSALETAGIQLVAPVQEHLLTPTELGEMMGGVNARTMNRILEAEGLQFKSGKHWHLTEKGKTYGEVCDMGRAHTHGAPVTHIRWRKSVLNLVME